MTAPARGLLIRTLPLVLLLAGLAEGTPAAAPSRKPNVDPQLGPFVHAQVMRAARRFGSPACALVLEDFPDERTGRRLAESLTAYGQTANEYLGSLAYRLGPAAGPCDNPQIDAYTSPGSRTIFICREQFLRRQRSSEGFAANILIHETLHSLGLGENPPTPSEITARVDARCGR